MNGSGANVGTQITLASGALLTVNADGTYTYDPNHAFDYLPGAASGASNTAATDTFTYTVDGGSTVTVTVNVNGVDSNDTLIGTTGNDTIHGGIGNDIIYDDNGLIERHRSARHQRGSFRRHRHVHRRQRQRHLLHGRQSDRGRPDRWRHQHRHRRAQW